ncbi:MAG: permease-like cell division protein FtsX, partial [Muribaculaceae bacterium]|nr:permease-like cell division protein FtsX [Muribaculaceae bacterium]
MKNNSLSKSSMFGKQIMSTVSVTIVLLILGVFAVIAISADQFTDTLKSRMGFTVVMNDAISENTIKKVEATLAQAPYVNSMKFTSAQETMEAWERDNGENVVDILGVNPFGAEFEVTVTGPYANSDSLTMITSRLRALEGIDEISTTTHVVEGINRIMHFISVVFIPLAIALLLVSAVLINNTVRLTVYASRFLIHTMRLVG